MSTIVFYRTHSGENNAPRPKWYSKELCLQSLLSALARDSEVGSVRVLHDGPLVSNCDWNRTLCSLIPGGGEIIETEKLGNGRSLLAALELAKAQPPESDILMAEDDYFWLPEATIAMRRALNGLPADYITAYDHPDRYADSNPDGPDAAHYYCQVHVTAERHWHAVESTCMTFMTKARTLREDWTYFERYHDRGHGTPHSRGLFRHLQGLGCAKTAGPRRLLFGPMPALATHAHVPFLGPTVDWKGQAVRVQADWAEYRRKTQATN